MVQGFFDPISVTSFFGPVFSAILLKIGVFGNPDFCTLFTFFAVFLAYAPFSVTYPLFEGFWRLRNITVVIPLLYIITDNTFILIYSKTTTRTIKQDKSTTVYISITHLVLPYSSRIRLRLPASTAKLSIPLSAK